MVLGAELACPDCGGLDIEVGTPGGTWDLQTELGPNRESDRDDEVSIFWSTYFCRECKNEYHFHTDGTMCRGYFIDQTIRDEHGVRISDYACGPM